MEIEIIIALIAIAVIGVIWYANRNTGLDANKDGKIDLKDAGVMLEQTAKVVVEEVKQTADVNKDGKVDVADVKEVATKAKTAVKKATAKKPAVKAKTAGRAKPKA
jgi:preprotein translocase subunit SecF